MYKEMMDTIGMVNSVDPEVRRRHEPELERQRENIELIASENIVSPAVMAAMGSVLTNKYAEGLPGKRYYGGCVYVDEVENIAIRRACELFGAKYANVQPHSGAQANLAVYFAPAGSGGHRHGHGPVPGRPSDPRFAGEHVGQELPLCLLRRRGGRAASTTTRWRRLSRRPAPRCWWPAPRLTPRAIDFERLAEIAHGYGAYLMVDMAHIAAWWQAGSIRAPVPYADVVTTTTHKTLRAPAAV